MRKSSNDCLNVPTSVGRVKPPGLVEFAGRRRGRERQGEAIGQKLVDRRQADDGPDERRPGSAGRPAESHVLALKPPAFVVGVQGVLHHDEVKLRIGPFGDQAHFVWCHRADRIDALGPSDRRRAGARARLAAGVLPRARRAAAPGRWSAMLRKRSGSPPGLPGRHLLQVGVGNDDPHAIDSAGASPSPGAPRRRARRVFAPTARAAPTAVAGCRSRP